jgi:hypothetical protein
MRASVGLTSIILFPINARSGGRLTVLSRSKESKC